MAKFNIKGDKSNPKIINWDSIGKEPIKIANIMATRNYGLFRFVEGNRPIDNHFMKIVKMIETVGTLWCPVLVNENFEIVDGQHRFEAFKFLNLPVIYVVQAGIGETEISAMNTVSKNWDANNWINYYANASSQQKQDYKFLQALKKMFPGYSPTVYDMTINGNVSGGGNQRVKDGTYEVTLEQYNDATKILSWLDKFKTFVAGVSGKKEYLHKALVFCYRHPDVDNEYMLQKFEKYSNKLGAISSVDIAVSEIQNKIYNFDLRGNHEPVNIVNAYDFYKKAKKYNGKKGM